MFMGVYILILLLSLNKVNVDNLLTHFSKRSDLFGDSRSDLSKNWRLINIFSTSNVILYVLERKNLSWT